MTKKFTEFLPGDLLRVFRTPTVTVNAGGGVEMMPYHAGSLSNVIAKASAAPLIRRGDIVLYIGSRFSKFSESPFHILLCHGYFGEVYSDSVMLTRELHFAGQLDSAAMHTT